MVESDIRRSVEAVWRIESAKIIAKLARMLRDVGRAEELAQDALVAALERGTIAGAALDVYENEPRIADGLRRPNVVLAPHLASASTETRTKMALMAVENTIALFDGRHPPNILNPEVLNEGAAI